MIKSPFKLNVMYSKVVEIDEHYVCQRRQF